MASKISFSINKTRGDTSHGTGEAGAAPDAKYVGHPEQVAAAATTQPDGTAKDAEPRDPLTTLIQAMTTLQESVTRAFRGSFDEVCEAVARAQEEEESRFRKCYEGVNNFMSQHGSEAVQRIDAAATAPAESEKEEESDAGDKVTKKKKKDKKKEKAKETSKGNDAPSDQTRFVKLLSEFAKIAAEDNGAVQDSVELLRAFAKRHYPNNKEITAAVAKPTPLDALKAIMAAMTAEMRLGQEPVGGRAARAQSRERDRRRGSLDKRSRSRSRSRSRHDARGKRHSSPPRGSDKALHARERGRERDSRKQAANLGHSGNRSRNGPPQPRAGTGNRGGREVRGPTMRGGARLVAREDRRDFQSQRGDDRRVTNTNGRKAESQQDRQKGASRRRSASRNKAQNRQHPNRPDEEKDTTKAKDTTKEKDDPESTGQSGAEAALRSASPVNAKEGSPAAAGTNSDHESGAQDDKAESSDGGDEGVKDASQYESEVEWGGSESPAREGDGVQAHSVSDEDL